MADSFYLGLDLGQMQDYTALTILQRLERRTPQPPLQPPNSRMGGSAYGPQPDKVERVGYHLRHAERLKLGTPYTEVAKRVLAVQASEVLAKATTQVVVDVTGVGLPVFEMLKAAGVKNLHGVSIHGGDAVTRDGSIHRVPKRDLVSTLQVLLQEETLKIADGLEHGPLLRHEMQNFKAKINIATGHDTYEAWREGDHDDLVLSLAMACWFAENHPPITPVRRPRSVVHGGLRY